MGRIGLAYFSFSLPAHQRPALPTCSHPGLLPCLTPAHATVPSPPASLWPSCIRLPPPSPHASHCPPAPTATSVSAPDTSMPPPLASVPPHASLGYKAAANPGAPASPLSAAPELLRAPPPSVFFPATGVALLFRSPPSKILGTSRPHHRDRSGPPLFEINHRSSCAPHRCRPLLLPCLRPRSTRQNALAVFFFSLVSFSQIYSCHLVFHSLIYTLSLLRF